MASQWWGQSLNSGTFNFDAWAPNHNAFLFQVRLISFSSLTLKTEKPILCSLLFKFHLSFISLKSCLLWVAVTFSQLFLRICEAITIDITSLA